MWCHCRNERAGRAFASHAFSRLERCALRGPRIFLLLLLAIAVRLKSSHKNVGILLVRVETKPWVNLVIGWAIATIAAAAVIAIIALPVSLLIVVAIVVLTYFLTTHGRKSPPPTKYPLAGFVAELGRSLHLEEEREITPREQVRARIHETILLEGCSAPDNSFSFKLKHLDGRFLPPLSSDEANQLEALGMEKIEQIRREGEPRGDLWKASPCHIVYPLTDSFLGTIEWKGERFSTLWALYKLLSNNAALWHRLAVDAAGPQMRSPSLLVTHNIVITKPEPLEGNGTKVPFVILAERNPHPPQVAYEEGLWSASFEEQVKVFGEPDRQEAESIEACMKRGVEEEFGIRPDKEPRILAVVMERPHFNIGIIGSLEVPYTYAEVERSWREKSVDKPEHWQLVALPLMSKYVEQCIKSDSIPAWRNTC